MEAMRKVAVIGAGTVGLLLARELAAEGIEVEVYERNKRPWVPVKASTILSRSGIETLGIDKGIAESALRGAIIHFGREKIVVKSNNIEAYVFERPKLNASIMNEAEKNGARIYLGRGIDDKLLSKMSGNYIIAGADGFPSTVAKYFSFPPINSYLLTYRAEYAADCGDKDMVELFFDNTITRGMFGWISPVGRGKIEIGIGIGKGFGNSRQAFRRFLDVEEIRKIAGRMMPLNEAAGMIPIGIRKRLVDDRKGVLLVGDAAGQVKKSTGGGIIFGGSGALLAAKAIRDFIDGKGSLNVYEKNWKRMFGFDYALHGMIRRAYSSLGNAQLERLAHVMRMLGIEAFLSRYGDMDSPSKMIRRFLTRG